MRIQSRRNKQKGSLLLAFFFMVLCGFIAFSALSLMPVEARAVSDAERRQVGSLAAEAGVIEVIAFLEDGGDPDTYGPGNPLESQTGDLASNWSYEAIIEDSADDASLPADVLRVTSSGQQDGDTMIETIAYIRRVSSPFFLDMMRVNNNSLLTAGHTTEYFGSVHINKGELEIHVPLGYGGGGLTTFHKEVTWSDTNYTAPTKTGKKADWDQLSSLNSDPSDWNPGFDGPVDPRPIPELDTTKTDNIFNGSSNPDNFWDNVLNGGSPPGTGVKAYADGGIFIEDDDDITNITLSLLSNPNDLNSVVNPSFDNDPTDNDLWQNAPGYDSSKSNAENSKNLHQKITIEYANGEKWDVVLDESSNQTKVYKNGANQASRGASGLSSEYVWIDGDVTVYGMSGANKGQRVFAAEDMEFEIGTWAQTPPLFRADVEPAEVAGGYGTHSKKPYTDATTERDGFTLATRGTFTLTNTGAKYAFMGDSSKKFYLMYHNILSYGDITYDIDPKSKFMMEVAGSLYSQNALELAQTSNDQFKFAQDPSNISLPGQSSEPDYDVFHYEENFYRQGK